MSTNTPISSGYGRPMPLHNAELTEAGPGTPAGELLRSGPNARKLVDKTKQFERQKKIDPLSNLQNDRVYLFSRAADRIVTTKVVDQVETFYKLVGVPAENIKYVKTINAGHALITDNSDDIVCSTTAPPFINDCDFIQPHEILKHIYGDLNPPATMLSGKLKSHLSALLAALIRLAYRVHTGLEWMDNKYRPLRQKLPSRQRLLNDIRALTGYLYFDSWEDSLDFMLQGFDHPPPKPTTG